ncbi:MAG TPA: SLC13 family permease [Acidimicrobiales bacterium]|nr:SLC13 family permease [Acidimicrobiales bacterium]
MRAAQSGQGEGPAQRATTPAWRGIAAAEQREGPLYYPPIEVDSARWGWLLAGAGSVGALVAALLDPAAARAAAAQDWPPFVLVAGLLLIGLVAHDDGLFAHAGRKLANAAPGDGALFGGAVVLIAAVTAVLNLDTSVAFLTPVLFHAGRARDGKGASLLYACVLVSNAASLLLPGSNLTNLIVLGHLHLSGQRFFVRTALPWVAAVVVTAGVVAVGGRRLSGEDGSDSDGARQSDPAPAPKLGPGLAGVLAAVVLVLVLRSPAVPVAVVGVLAAGAHFVRRGQGMERALNVLGLPVLVGLLGVAVALGALGRAWTGPERILGHLDTWATAGVAAGTSVLVNNLPAASLLAARVPRHPFALLVGLDVGPNLFVTGSLSWILWLQAARTVGARPSVARATRLGLVATPIAMAAALAALQLTRAA